MMANDTFRRDFAKLLKAAGDKADLVVRKTALELQTGMVEMSPVDTGRFKGNWQCGVNSINPHVGDKEDKTPLGSFGPDDSVLRSEILLKAWILGQTIYLTNSIPYAQALERGHSKQAPSGCVRLTVQNYTKALSKAVSEIK